MTPAPTQSPEPALPAEVVEKFDKAGINPSDLQNTIIDQNGMHITIDGQVIDISLDEFNANTFNAVNSNAIRIIDTANKDGVFVINPTEDGKWLVEKLTFTPANDIEFSENLSKYDLSIAPDADRQAIYKDIAISHIGDATSKSEGMEFNRKVYEEIIKDHPEWEGIALGDDYEVRGEFMQEFLTRTGGLMTMTDMYWNKFEADFNKPIGFGVIEVDKLPSEYPDMRIISFDGKNRGGGGIMTVNSDGQIVYKVAFTQQSIEFYMHTEQRRSTAQMGVDKIVSELFAQTTNSVAYHQIVWFINSASDYRLYIGARNPSVDIVFRNSGGPGILDFQKVARSFLKIVK